MICAEAIMDALRTPALILHKHRAKPSAKQQQAHQMPPDREASEP